MGGPGEPVGTAETPRHDIVSMKVGYTITSYPPAVGGAQVHLHELIRHLVPGIQPRVACLWSENRTDWLLGTTVRAHARTEDYEIDGVPVTRLGFGLSERLRMGPAALAYPLAQRQAARWIASCYRPHLEDALEDAALIHNVRVGREPLSYASLQLARSMGVPYVFEPLHHPRWVGWFYRVYLEIYRAADIILALTETEKQVLIDLGVAGERIFVTGRGPTLAPTADGEGFKQRHQLDGPVILFLGQKYPYKGFESLLQAAPQVWLRDPSARFVFIGPRTHASQRAFESVRDPRILELDTVSLQEKTDALAACTALCVPSTQESFGGVYTEAWALGKPVIGGSAPAIREVIENERDGLLVTPRAEVVAEAINRLLHDPDLADALGKRGQQKLHDLYQWDRIAQRTLEAYEWALHRPARSVAR